MIAGYVPGSERAREKRIRNKYRPSLTTIREPGTGHPVRNKRIAGLVASRLRGNGQFTFMVVQFITFVVKLYYFYGC